MATEIEASKIVALLSFQLRTEEIIWVLHMFEHLRTTEICLGNLFEASGSEFYTITGFYVFILISYWIFFPTTHIIQKRCGFWKSFIFT